MDAPVDTPVQETPAQETPTQPTQEAPLVDAQGNFREGWSDSPTLSKFTNVKSLAGSYQNLERMLGKDKIVIPGDDSPDEAWDQVYDRLGRPAMPDDYAIEKPDDLPEGIPWDDEAVGEFKKVAHKLGLNQRQMRELVQFDLDRMVAAHKMGNEAYERNQQEQNKVLEDEWGSNYHQQIELAQKAAQAINPELIDDPVLGNDPRVIKMLAKVGGMMSEGRLKAGREMFMPQVDVDAEISQIRETTSGHRYAKAYANKMHPDHKAAVDYMQSLYKRKFPEPKK